MGSLPNAACGRNRRAALTVSHEGEGYVQEYGCQMSGAHPLDGRLVVTGDSSERFNLMYIVYVGKLSLDEGKTAWPSVVAGRALKPRYR